MRSVRFGLIATALALGACGSDQERDRERRPRDRETLEISGKNKGLLAVEQAAASSAAPTPMAIAASAQSGASANAPAAAGSTQRAAIMDALRPAIEQKLGSPVEFVVRRAAVQDGWALVIADPQRPGGGPIDPADHFPADDLEFMDGLTVNGVLRFSGGAWTLVDHAIGPTDVWYCGVDGPPAALTGC